MTAHITFDEVPTIQLLVALLGESLNFRAVLCTFAAPLLGAIIIPTASAEAGGGGSCQTLWGGKEFFTVIVDSRILDDPYPFDAYAFYPPYAERSKNLTIQTHWSMVEYANGIQFFSATGLIDVSPLPSVGEPFIEYFLSTVQRLADYSGVTIEEVIADPDTYPLDFVTGYGVGENQFDCSMTLRYVWGLPFTSSFDAGGWSDASTGRVARTTLPNTR